MAIEIDKLVGHVVQGWKLSSVLGEGADGIVYAAERDGKPAAVKLFFPDALEKNGLSAAKERLDLQISLIGEKQHPNLVEVYAGGEDSELNTLFLVMELVPGTSLDKLIGKVPPQAVAHLAGQLAAAAQFLSKKDLIHRDIKPANIVVSDDFKTLTLLDLGIVHQAVTDDDQGRLSGMEFVATVRYSPREFVWRREEGDAEAWKAVTFYQIGATLHDMIMGATIFADCDTPRARLYDAVRDTTPTIKSDSVEAWLVQTAQACLLKDWRERLEFVSWESFTPPGDVADASRQEERIRLLQAQMQERQRSAEKTAVPLPGQTPEQQIWMLNDGLAHELRTYLRVKSMFPLCCVSDHSPAPNNYVTTFSFEKNEALGFGDKVEFVAELGPDPAYPSSRRLSFSALRGRTVLTTATWTEMFTVETAFAACRAGILEAVEAMITRKD